MRVVAGFRAPELLAVLKPLQARVITNPHFERGMYTSVQVAVDTFEPEVDAFFILPVDSPLVSSVTIKKMLSAYGKGRQKIIYPVFAGQRGHPPLIWAGYKKEILGEMHPEGLRGVLSRHEAEARELEVFDEAVLLEMDTFDEYQGLLRYLGYFPLPSTEESSPCSGNCNPGTKFVNTATQWRLWPLCSLYALTLPALGWMNP